MNKNKNNKVNKLSDLYELICELLYDRINKIFDSYNRNNKTYSHKVKNFTSSFNDLFLTKNSDSNSNFEHISKIILQRTNDYKDEWLYFIRELIIFVLKHFSSLTEESFNIIKVDSLIKIKLLILYVIFFNYDSLSFYNETKHNLYVGIDFEFNDKHIALCQVAFFSNRTSKFIFIFNPSELDGIQTDLIIKYMFTSNSISKIVHGSDSLDIPYLFQDFFMNNHLLIYDFVKNIVDTRFLCEYSKIISSYKDKKCSIYDALLYFDIINKNKYKNLLEINKSLENSWDIHKMKTNMLNYAFYDVIYLYPFYRSIVNSSPEYKYIILINRLIFLDKWDIVELSKNIKSEIDPLNNYIIKTQTKNNKFYESTMINLFNSVIDKIVIQFDSDSTKIAIKSILDINYFKSTLNLIFKKVIYSILTSNFDIYKNKKELYTDLPLSCNDIYLTLKNIKLEELNKFIKLFYRESYKYIIKFIN